MGTILGKWWHGLKVLVCIAAFAFGAFGEKLDVPGMVLDDLGMGLSQEGIGAMTLTCLELKVVLVEKMGWSERYQVVKKPCASSKVEWVGPWWEV